jgi:hypothetical protein
MSLSFLGDWGGGRCWVCPVCDGEVAGSENEFIFVAVCPLVCGDAAPNRDIAHNQENRTKTLTAFINGLASKVGLTVGNGQYRER